MRPISGEQDIVRYPLNELLGTHANVRLLRVLIEGVDGPVSVGEAAAQAGTAGVIHEMRPLVGTFAHKTGDLAEMVCSNSFRSDDDEQNAVGLLHWEMRAAGSLVMAMADRHRLPSGRSSRDPSNHYAPILQPASRPGAPVTANPR